jgi:peptidyl-prolyl cis-trans isomerase SurA
MFKKIFIPFALLIGLTFCSCAPEHSNIVLSKFDDQNVTMGEFEKAYLKNSNDSTVAQEDSIAELKNFLNVYTQFRMKLADAKSKGFEHDPELNKEMNDYKDKIGITLFLNDKIVTPGIKKLYNRRKYELRVSHIMFRTDSADAEKVKALANAVLDSIKHGASFEEMAKKHSEDMYSKMRGGDINYVTAGELPSGFEDAMYSDSVGQVYPKVVRSPYGFHIIKVTDKKKRIPEIRVSHIFVPFARKGKEIDSAGAKAKIDSIYAMAKAGQDFAELAKKYSEDPSTSSKGGDLGFVERRKLIPPLGETAFNLKVGEISNVVKSPYGYHILKVTDEKQIPPFDKDIDQLKEIFKKTRYNEEYDSLVNSLKVKYDFKVDGENLNSLVSDADTMKVGNDSLLIQKVKGKLLYSFDHDSVTSGQFLSTLNQDQTGWGKKLSMEYVTSELRKLSSDSLIQKDAENFEKTDSTYQALMKEYREGIYVFKIEQDEIWNKINADSTNLYQYYLQHMDKYQWPNRVDFSEIYTTKDSIINAVYDKLKSGVSFDSLAAKYTERPGYKNKAGHNGVENVSSSKLSEAADSLSNTGDFSKPFKDSDGYSIVMLNEKLPARAKTFDEAKTEVSADYQDAESNKLRDAYEHELINKYKPVYYYDKLSEAFPGKGIKADKSK